MTTCGSLFKGFYMNTQPTVKTFTMFFLLSLFLSFGQHVIAETNLKEMYKQADTLLKEKAYFEALGLFEDILSQNPDFIDGYRGMIECYDALGDDQGAAVFIESLYLENPDNAGINYGMGFSLFRRKQYPAAGEYFDKAIRLNPELAEAWNNRAAIFQFVEKNYDSASTYYEKAIAIGKKTGNQRVVDIAQKNMAHLPQKEVLKPVTDALTLEDFLNQFIERTDRNDKKGLKELVLGQKENCEKAMRWFVEQAVRASGSGNREEEESIRILARMLGDLYEDLFKSDRLNRELQDYRKLSEEHKRLFVKGELFLQRGADLEEKSLYPEAIADYQQSLECFQKIRDERRQGIVHSYLGNTYAKSEIFASACEAYENSLTLLGETLGPKGKAQLLSSSGSACFHAGQYDRAMDFLSRSLTLYRQIDDQEAVKKVEQNILLVKKKLP